MHRLTSPLLDSPPLLRHGLPELVYGVNPAAGTDYSVAMPGQYFTRLISLFVRLVCDANVASREVVVSYEDQSGARYGLAGAATTLTASATGDYYFSTTLGTDIFTVDSSALSPLPPVLLRPTDVIKIHVPNIQATDQLSRIRYVWERFYTTDQPPHPAPHSGT